MTGHYDALALGGALFIAFLALALTLAAVHHRRQRASRAAYRAKLAAERERHQVQTHRDRVAYWKLHQTFVAYVNGVPMSEGELHARLNAVDEPIPHAVAEGYAPTWTEGAAQEEIDAEFGNIVRLDFPGGAA